MDWTQVSQTAGVALSGLISWGIIEGINWIKAHTQATKYANAAAKIENLAQTIVAGYMPSVEKAKAGNLGLLQEHVADSYQTAAANRLGQLAGNEVKQIVAAQGPVVEQYLKSEIERALVKIKKTSANGAVK